MIKRSATSQINQQYDTNEQKDSKLLIKNIIFLQNFKISQLANNNQQKAQCLLKGLSVQNNIKSSQICIFYSIPINEYVFLEQPVKNISHKRNLLNPSGIIDVKNMVNIVRNTYEKSEHRSKIYATSYIHVFGFFNFTQSIQGTQYLPLITIGNLSDYYNFLNLYLVNDTTIELKYFHDSGNKLLKETYTFQSSIKNKWMGFGVGFDKTNKAATMYHIDENYVIQPLGDYLTIGFPSGVTTYDVCISCYIQGELFGHFDGHVTSVKVINLPEPYAGVNYFSGSYFFNEGLSINTNVILDEQFNLSTYSSNSQYSVQQVCYIQSAFEGNCYQRSNCDDIVFEKDIYTSFQSGKYLISTIPKCISCGSNCLQCTAVDECLQCRPSYIVVNGNCYRCDNLVSCDSQCPNGQKFDSFNQMCVSSFDLYSIKLFTPLLSGRIFTDNFDITVISSPTLTTSEQIIYCYIDIDNNPATLYSFLGGTKFTESTIIKKLWTQIPKGYKKSVSFYVLFYGNGSPQNLEVKINSKHATMDLNYEIIVQNKIQCMKSGTKTQSIYKVQFNILDYQNTFDLSIQSSSSQWGIRNLSVEIFKCHPTCDSCKTGGSSYDCTTCSTGFTLNKFQCICPYNQYAQYYNCFDSPCVICQTCSVANCLICEDITGYCLECMADYSIKDGLCVQNSVCIANDQVYSKYCGVSQDEAFTHFRASRVFQYSDYWLFSQNEINFTVCTTKKCAPLLGQNAFHSLSMILPNYKSYHYKLNLTIDFYIYKSIEASDYVKIYDGNQEVYSHSFYSQKYAINPSAATSAIITDTITFLKSSNYLQLKIQSVTDEPLTSEGQTFTNVVFNYVRCHPLCKECNGSTQSSCTICIDQASKVNGDCECNSGYYFQLTRSPAVNSFPGSCQLCNSVCKTCTGPSYQHCINCQDGYTMDNNICIYNCQIGYFFDQISQTCIQCHISCKSCEQSNLKNDCRDCFSGYSLNLNDKTCIYDNIQFQFCTSADNFLCGGTQDHHYYCLMSGWRAIDSNNCINCSVYANGKCGGQYYEIVSDFCLTEGFYKYDANNCSSCSDIVLNNCGRIEINSICTANGWVKKEFISCINCSFYVKGKCGGQFSQRIIESCMQAGYYNYDSKNCSSCSDTISNKCGKSEINAKCTQNGWFKFDLIKCVNCTIYANGKCGGQFSQNVVDYCFKQGYNNYDNNTCSSCSEVISNNCGRNEINARCQNGGWIKYSSSCVNCSLYIQGQCGGQYTQIIANFCQLQGYFNYDSDYCSSCSNNVQNKCGRIEINPICEQIGWIIFNANQCVYCLQNINGKCGGQSPQNVIDFCKIEGYYNYDKNNCSSCNEVVSNSCGGNQISSRCQNNGWIKKNQLTCINCSQYIDGRCGGQYPQSINEFCELEFYNYDSFNCSSCSEYISNNCGRSEISAKCQQSGWISLDGNECANCLISANGNCVFNLSQNLVDFCLKEGYYTKNTVEQFRQCDYQNIAVIDATLSGSEPQLTILFGKQITIPNNFQIDKYSVSLCQYLFPDKTRKLIGKTAECSINDTSVSVKLGQIFYLKKYFQIINFQQIEDNAEIIQGDFVYFKSNVLSFVTSDTIFIDMYINNMVVQEQIVGQSKVVFQYSPVENSCSDINITFQKIVNDAKRGFFKFQWSITSFVPSNPPLESLLLDILSKANAQKQIDLVIPKGIIKIGIKATIKFDYTLRLNSVSFEELDLSVKAEKKILFNIQSLIKTPYFKYQIGTIMVQPIIMICSPEGDIQVTESLNFSIQSIEFPDLNYSNSMFKESEYVITIQPYTLKPGKTFINIKGNLLSDQFKESQQDYQIDVQPSPLVVKIIGGDGYFSYQKQIVMSCTVRDNDLQSETDPQGISIQWKCLDAGTLKNCIDRLGNEVIFPSEKLTATFEEYTFNPYTTAKVVLIGKKDVRESTASIMVLFSELDLPPLGIRIITSDLETINLNEEVVVILEYNTSVNVDLLSFSGTIQYNNNVVGIIKFDYTKLRFQIWNYFNDFKRNQNSFQIRFNIYNPQYYMPSITLITFNINFPPINCKLSITPNQSGFSIETKFFIQFLDCEDENKPVQYQFFYYQSIVDYEYEKQYPSQIKRRQLSDKQKYNFIETSFPSGDLLILAQAIDSKNAIFNSTVEINVQKKQYDETSYLKMIQTKLDQISQSQVTAIISDLSIICDDMVERAEFKSSSQINLKKIEILNQLISLQEKLPSLSLFSTVVDKAIDSLNKSGINQDQSQKTQLIDQLLTQLELTSNLQQSNLELSKEKLKQKLFDSFQVVDSLKNSGSENQPTDKYIELTNKIAHKLFVNILPNEEPILFKGQQYNLLGSQITEKFICLYFFCNENKFTQSSKQSEIYNYQISEYKDNPYSKDESFVNYTKSLKEQKPNQEIETFQVLTPKISNNLNEQIESFPKKTMLSFTSKITGPAKNMTCLSKDVSNGWVKNLCNMMYDDTSKSYLCFCKDLSPTTIIEDLEELFENENIDTVISSEGITNISNFKEFYKYAVFWLLLFKSIIFLKFYSIGRNLDMSDQQFKLERVRNFDIKEYFSQENTNYPKNKILPQIQVKNSYQESDINQCQLKDYNYFSSDNVIQSPINKSTESPLCSSPLKSVFSKNTQQTENINIIDLDRQNTEFQKLKYQTLQINDDKLSPQVSKINIDSQIVIKLQDNAKVEFQQSHRRRRKMLENLDQSGQFDSSKQMYTDRKLESNGQKINYFNTKNNQEIVKPKSESISSIITKDNSESVNQPNKYQGLDKVPYYKQVAVFHNFFEIFFIFNPFVSRRLRFLIFYLRTVHSLAISIVFDESYSLVQQVGLAIFNSLSVIVVIKIFLVTFSLKNIIGKIISRIVTLGVLLGYIYIILSIASGQTSTKSNQFFFPFLIFYLGDVLVISVISALIQRSIAKRILSKQKTSGFSNVLFRIIQLKLVLISVY